MIIQHHFEFQENRRKYHASSAVAGLSSYELNIPWYLKHSYYEKFQLSQNDIRQSLLVTPVPILIQLNIMVGHNIADIIPKNFLHDHFLVSVHNWIEQVQNNMVSGTHPVFSNEDSRIATILSNSLMRLFHFKQGLHGTLSKSPQDRCICPFDTHCPPLPVYLNNNTSGLSVPVDVPRGTWMADGAYHGYAKFYNQEHLQEQILVQTHQGHEYLQNFELSNRKRKELFLASWRCSLYET